MYIYFKDMTFGVFCTNFHCYLFHYVSLFSDLKVIYGQWLIVLYFITEERAVDVVCVSNYIVSTIAKEHQNIKFFNTCIDGT